MSAGVRERWVRIDPFRRLALGTAVLFVLLVALELHGFSLPYWHGYVDGSPAPEVLAGEARKFRWDDYAVQLPMALGQAAHAPPFPVVNANIGLGQNMLVPTPLPVAHAATLFRPTLWGFFLGADLGLAWMWWSQILGVLLVWMAVLHRLLRVPLGLAAGGCGLILCSPFFQFWSFNMATVTTHAGLCALGVFGLLCARRAGAILASGLLLGWAGGSFLLTLYLPYLVSLAFLFLVLLVGVGLERKQEFRWSERRAWRIAGLALALALAAAAVLALYSGASEAIEALRRTEYPGLRAAQGGDRPFWWLLNACLAVPPRLHEDGWGTLGNPCEAASFWLASPWIGLALLWRWWRGGGRPDPLALGLLGYCFVGLVYCHFGFGDVLARVTLFAQVPGKRMLLGLTVAEALLVVRFASAPGAGPRRARLAHAGLALTWTLVLGVGAGRLSHELPDLSAGWLAGAAALNGVVVYALAERWRPQWVLGGVVVALGASTSWFNPLVRGGADYLRSNALARHVVAIDRACGGDSVWAAYGLSDLASLLVANDVQVINGVHALPQLALWERLDPERQLVRDYNRYANVHLSWPPPAGQPPGMRLAGDSNLTLYLHPDGKQLRKLGATHLVVSAPQGTRLAEFFQPFEPLARVAHHALFALPLREGGDDR